MASVGVDPVPHCGALVTLLAICGLTHKEAYYDIAVLMGLKFLFPLFVCSSIWLWGLYKFFHIKNNFKKLKGFI